MAMTTIIERYYPEDVVESIISRHLRITPEDGTLYEQARRCVCNAFDAAEDYTNRIILSSQAIFTIAEAEGGILRLPTAPIRFVEEVSYLASDGEWHTLSDKDYEFAGNSRFAHIELIKSVEASRYRVTAECGFEDYSVGREDPLALPGAIEQAVSLMAETFFNGEALSGATEVAVHNMLNPWRIYPYGG